MSVLYVYRCASCGCRGELRLFGDAHDGELTECRACGASVTLEWDGGVTLGLSAGDRVSGLFSGRVGTVVKVYGDGSAACCWDDGSPQAEGLAHERMPRSLLTLIPSRARNARR